MKKKSAASLVLWGTLCAVGCSDDPTQISPQPDGGSGGSAGSGSLAGSAGSAGTAAGAAGKAGAGGSAGSSAGAAGKAGAGGAGGNVLDGGADDVSVGDDAGEASTGDEVPVEAATFDDGSFPDNATIGSCNPLNWIATASSSAANNPVTNAFDGLLSSRWSTGAGQSFGAYYQIDFGGFVQLSQITLNNTGSPGDHPRGFDVQTSRDGFDFSNVIASGMPGDTAPPNNLVTIDFPARAVRYLRIQLNAASGSWWSVHELGLSCLLPTADGGFTTDQPPSDTLCGPGVVRPDAGADAGGAGAADGAGADGADGDSIADSSSAETGSVDSGPANPFDRSRWTVSASNTSTNASDAIGNAIDGNIATRWSSGRAQAGNEFFKVDLGSVGCVGQVRLVATGTDFVAAYTVGVSTDDVTYITVAKGTGSNVMQIGFTPRFARFVRINQVGTSASWWSIDELAVLP
jgi:endo-1,3(4)-beta-glucanase